VISDTRKGGELLILVLIDKVMFNPSKDIFSHSVFLQSGLYYSFGISKDSFNEWTEILKLVLRS